MEVTAIFNCGFCGEANEIFIDVSAGFAQNYTEDCSACCRPNDLSIKIHPASLEVDVEVEYQG
jgi:hypothetical protein